MNTTTTTTPHNCTHAHCPPVDQLDQLVHGRLSEPDSDKLCNHVGECEGCQNRMDEIATGDVKQLSSVVRHIDRDIPPSDSAYWRAVGQVQATITGAYPITKSREAEVTDPAPTQELKLDFLAPSDVPDRLGKLSRFEVLRVVGRGGMGVVLHGYDPSLQRDVALKILDPMLANNSVAYARFCREARAAAAVTHDNIVAIHQVDRDERSGLPYLVMQLVNGESLDQRLQRVGKLSIPDAVRLGMQAAAGLASAHAGGLIHRDIKPGNILIESGSEKIKLTDFGLARATEDMKLTRTGFVAGTPLYMAPEQARGDEVDARADLFSLGSVLYESLAGAPPFDGKTPLAVLRRVADDTQEPLSKRNADVPEWLEDVIDRLLEKDPAHRFQTAAEVSEILAVHLSLIQPLSPLEATDSACSLVRVSGSRFSRRRRVEVCWKKVATLAGVFLLGAGLGGITGWSLAPKSLTHNSAMLPVDGMTAKSIPAGPQPFAVLPAGAGAVWSVAMTSDGKTLAMGLESGRISLWDISANPPRVAIELPAHKGPVWAVDFTADGKQLVTASDDATVKVWDVATGKSIKSLPVGTSVRTATVSPSGNWVAVGDRFGTVRIFDLNQDRPLLEYEQGSVVNGVAFSPDELTVASVSTDGSVWLWEIAANRKRFTLTGHNGPVYGLGFSRDGQRLATASWDHQVIVWDLNSGTPARKIDAHEEGVWAVQFSPNGKALGTAGQDGTAKLWDAETGTRLATFAGHRGTVHAIRFGRDGKILATGGRDGTVRLWDTTPFLK